MPVLLRHLRVLSLLALIGAAWTDPEGRFSLGLPEDWRVVTGATPLLQEEALRAASTLYGAGFALRSWDAEALLRAGPRVKRAVDLDAVMSGDRVAAFFQRDQDLAETGPTVYLGPADGVDPALGRWVYLPPQEPRRVWWQVFWRTDDRVHQLVGWCPIAEFGRCALDFRAIEGQIVRQDTLPPTRLFESGEDGCGAPLRADRARAMRASERFGEARSRLRDAHVAYREREAAPLPPDAALRLGELSATQALMRATEACVHRVAREQRVCAVEEGPARDERDGALQSAVVDCLNADPGLSDALGQAIAPYLGTP